MNQAERLLLGWLLGAAGGATVALAAFVWRLWQRARWVRHSPQGWLFGWTRIPGEWFILHLGPGFLEWGTLSPAARLIAKIRYVHPRP